MTSGSAGDESRGSPRPAFAVERVIGASHVRSGKPCQDEAGVWSIADTVAVAVADGHGSSRHADVGARLAVHVALSSLVRFAEDLGERAWKLAEVQSYAEHPLRVQLVREWAQRVRSKAGSDDAPLLDYGSTVLFALSTPAFLLVGQLGDGDILLVSRDGQVRAPLPPDPTAFADETPSLCLPDAAQSLRVLVLPPPGEETLLLLSTDGYSKSYATDAVFHAIGPDYLDLVRTEGVHGVQAHLRGFLEQVTAQGSGDDIALGLLYWAGPAEVKTETPVQDQKGLIPLAETVPREEPPARRDEPAVEVAPEDNASPGSTSEAPTVVAAAEPSDHDPRGGNDDERAAEDR